jgi:hypothetical protein
MDAGLAAIEDIYVTSTPQQKVFFTLREQGHCGHAW